MRLARLTPPRPSRARIQIDATITTRPCTATAAPLVRRSYFTDTADLRLCMRVKTCTRCGETKPLDQFPPVRRSEPEKLQCWCRKCFSEANKRNYWKNPERERARLLLQTTRKREDNRRRAIEYLLSHPCVDCGEKDIVVLQFDHLRDKSFNVSTMIA